MYEELLHRAFRGLYPSRHIPELGIRFSGKFSDYNGNVLIQRNGRNIERLEFGLSRLFSDSDETIVIGIIQHLLNKTYRTNVQTTEQDFYHKFIKHLNKYANRSDSDPLLKTLYEELNEEYFNGLLDKPNMQFVGENTTTMGNYNYSKDLVTISSILKEDRDLLKYVLYHELLHKKHSFSTSKTGRSQYHTPAFRADEKKFTIKDIEQRLQKFVRKKKVRKTFRFF